MQSKLYLAYGSNLNLVQMFERCPAAELMGYTYINGYRLVYRGSLSGFYLSIEPGGDADRVPCGVFRIWKMDELRLDLYEGYPRFYTKQIFTDLPLYTMADHRRGVVSGMAYILPSTCPAGLPSRTYIEVCRQGYRDFGFDTAYLERAYNLTKEMLTHE